MMMMMIDDDDDDDVMELAMPEAVCGSQVDSNKVLQQRMKRRKSLVGCHCDG